MPRFGLPLIPEGPQQRRVIGMDYNLFVRHSMGVENRKDSAVFEERTLDAYRKAFQKQYEGDRIPLQLGFHFVEMNGGAYWRALDRFLTETCGKPDVACVSYAQALPMIARTEKGGSLRLLSVVLISQCLGPIGCQFASVCFTPEKALVDRRQRLVVDRGLESLQTLVDRHQLDDRRPGIDPDTGMMIAPDQKRC